MKGIGFDRHNLQAQAWLDDAKAIQNLAEKLSSALDKNRNVTNTQSAEQQKNNTQKGAKYLIEQTETGKQYVFADRQVIKGEDASKWGGQVTNYINENIRKGKDVVVYAQDGDPLTITQDTAGKARFRNNVRLSDGTTRLMTDDEYAVKLRAETHIDELSKVSKRGKKDVPDMKNHNFAKDGFNYRTAYFMDFDGSYYRLTLSVGKNGTINTVYNVGKIKKEDKYSLSGSKPVANKSATMRSSSSNKRISQNKTSVNKQSMRDTENNSSKSKSSVDDTIYTDTEYMKAVENNDMETAQRLVDEVAKTNGYTIKAYHGTTNQQEKSVWNDKTKSYDTEYKKFTVFKKQYDEQVGHFFNDDVDNAGGYGSILYSVYLKMNKPLVIDCNGQNYASIVFDGKEMNTEAT